jgi:hypothetical protein
MKKLLLNLQLMMQLIMVVRVQVDGRKVRLLDQYYGRKWRQRQSYE